MSGTYPPLHCMRSSRMLRAKSSPMRRAIQRSVRSRTICVAKENPASGPTKAADAAVAPTGVLSRLLATTSRKAMVFGGIAATIIGIAAAWTLIFQPSEQATSAQKLAQAFTELDKGNRLTSRQLAAKVLADSGNSYTEHGGAYF